jgi:hypothetical protein
MPQRNVPVINHHKKDRLTAAFLVFVCILTAGGLTACRKASKQGVDYSSAQHEWREGDIVFRCGYGVESKAVTMRTSSDYSHVGLLHYDSLKGEWQVIHAVPGEEEPEYVKSEPVSVFFSPERAGCGAWMRVDCSDSVARQAVQYALNKVAQQVLFDNDYLLDDSTQLYCTELIWRAYQTQCIDVTGGQIEPVPTLFSREGRAIFPSNIERSETTLFMNHLK